jgi:hypothetical protein
MDKKKIIIISSIVVIAGVGGYFGYQWFKKRKEKKKESESKESTENSTSGGTSSGTSSSSSTTSVSAPATTQTFSFPSTWTKKEGDAFRQWVNANYPDYAKSIQLDVSGGLNAYLDKAYQKYGSTYTASSKPQFFKVGDIVSVVNDIIDGAKYKKDSNGNWVLTGAKQNISKYDQNKVVQYFTIGSNRYVMIAPVGTTASFIATSESNLKKV